MPYTTYLSSLLNKAEFGSTDHVPTVTHYVGLSTTGPEQDGTNVTEPDGGSYARVAVTNNTTNWVATSTQPDGGGQQQENGTAIEFPGVTADWGFIGYFVIYDASTSGNLLAYGSLDEVRNILTNDTVKFPAGTLKISLD